MKNPAERMQPKAVRKGCSDCVTCKDPETLKSRVCGHFRNADYFTPVSVMW